MKNFCETLYISGFLFLIILSKEIDGQRRRIIRQTFNLSVSSFSFEDFQSSPSKNDEVDIERIVPLKTRSSNYEKGKLKILNYHPTRSENPVIFSNSGQEKPVRLTHYSVMQADEPSIIFLDTPALKPPKDPKGKPTCARNATDTYCTKINNYPEDYINMLFAHGAIKDNGLFGVDRVKFSVTQRIDVDNEQPLCHAKEDIEYPKVGETEDGDWFFILNTEQLKQGVRVEKCVNAGSPCSFLKMKTKCVQKYLYRKLVAIRDGHVTDMKFKIPSCCMCTVQPSDHLVHRRSTYDRRISPKFKKISKRDTPVQDKNSKRLSTDNFLSDTLVFPDQFPLKKVALKPELGPKGPTCANGGTFCKNTTNYPRDYVKNLVKQNSLKDYALFGSDIDPPVDIVTRFDDTGMTMCGVRMEKIFPEVARTEDDVWKYIVQGDEEEYKQAVVLEMCQNEGGSCNFPEEFPAGYKSFCKQKYVYRQMLSIPPDGGKPNIDHFQLPSCCVCQVKSVQSVANRFGVPTLPFTPAKRSRRHRKS